MLVFHTCHICVAVITPPMSKRHILVDTEATLAEAAQFLAQKASQKRAPLPPKRTSSFKDQCAHQAHLRSMTHLSPAGDEFGLMATSMTDSIDMSIATGGDSLSDHQNRSLQSSSDDLLSSTPASQSRNGSLERILEHGQPSRHGVDVPFGGSSSYDQKTPDTDASDISLPPPPISLLADASSGVNTLPKSARFTGNQSGIIADQSVLNQLRQSLKKSAPRPMSTVRKSYDNVDDDSGHSSPKGGFFGDRSSRSVVSGYGTVPRGTGSSSYLTSGDTAVDLNVSRQIGVKHNESSSELDSKTDGRLTESCSNIADMVLHMPTPEVRRKVEEWQAGVERSLRQAAATELQVSVSDNNQRVQAGRNKRATGVLSNVNRLHSASTDKDTIQRDWQSSDDSTMRDCDSDEHNVKPSTLVRVPVTHAVVNNSADSAELKSDRPKWKWSKNKNTPSDKSASSEHNAQSSKILLPMQLDVSQQVNSGLSIMDTTAANHLSADVTHEKPAAKPRKSNAVQSMFFSAVDFPFDGTTLSSKKVDSVEMRERSSNIVSVNKSDSTKPAKSDLVKPIPAGAKPVLPVFKPGQAQHTQQLTVQSSLRHYNTATVEREATTTVVLDITKDNVTSLAHSLSQRLVELTGGTKPGPSPGVLQPLTDEIRALHYACSSYVESLPPHAKFQFRELLVTLESTADSVRTSSGRDLDRYLVTLQNLIRNIESALKK